MGRIADQFASRNHTLPSFSEQYGVYETRMREIELDLSAPKGFATFVGRTLGKAGVFLGRQVPYLGVVANFVDGENVANHAGELANEWLEFVRRKVQDPEEARLILEPVEVLSPLLVQDLRQVADRHLVALFFDTYERTGALADNWLRALLDGRYGDLPLNTIFVIAGREQLDRNQWAQYEDMLARLPLETFTEQEALEYLSLRGISDSRLIEVILHLSGRLPLLVATLATGNPSNPEGIGDPSGTAVERFLRWIDDPNRRRVALDGALPRSLNLDLLAVLVDDHDTDVLFDWLRSETAFVEERVSGWVYHSVVRDLMLRHKRRSSPQAWTELHDRLALYYEKQRDSFGLEENHAMLDPIWQTLTSDIAYHRLCQAPQANLPAVLGVIVAALFSNASFASVLLETLQDVAKDSDSPEIARWTELFARGLASSPRDLKARIVLDTELLEHARLAAPWRLRLLNRRGYAYYLSHQLDLALADLAEAIILDPGDAHVYISRAHAYQAMDRDEEALADFNRGLQLKPNKTHLSCRGRSYLALGKHQEALADFNETLEAQPDRADAFAFRGKTYLSMDRPDEALKDLDRAIEWDSNEAFFYYLRGVTRRCLGRIDDALFDLDRAVELAPRSQRFLLERAHVSDEAGNQEGALADFDQVLSLNPTDPHITKRTEIMLGLGRNISALDYVDNAVELKADNIWALVARAKVQRALGRFQEAESDLCRAVGLNPAIMSSIAMDWGLLLSYLGRYSEAIDKYHATLESNPNDLAALYNIAVVMSRWKGFSKAESAVKAALEVARTLNEQDGRVLYAMAGLAALSNNDEAALQKLQRAIAVEAMARDWARHDIAWMSLRADPQFQALVG